jgi:hypothetical protein
MSCSPGAGDRGVPTLVDVRSHTRARLNPVGPLIEGRAFNDPRLNAGSGRHYCGALGSGLHPQETPKLSWRRRTTWPRRRYPRSSGLSNDAATDTSARNAGASDCWLGPRLRTRQSRRMLRRRNRRARGWRAWIRAGRARYAWVRNRRTLNGWQRRRCRRFC